MKNTIRSRIRGCLMGGAAGDALGYAVEFAGMAQIRAAYGERGITGYAYDKKTGRALISDDTQMTLFTAAGIIDHAENGAPERQLFKYIEKAYIDWLLTQQNEYGECAEYACGRRLMDVPELYSLRAPGGTCLSGLQQRSEEPETDVDDLINKPINDSKGCGGVMRVAPVGCIAGMSAEALAMEGAYAAAVTHGHPLGYMPGAVLAYIVNRLVYRESDMPLAQLAARARDMLPVLFGSGESTDTMRGIIDKSIMLAANGDADLVNIRRIGEGWVGEEALAVALYCCLRHENSFSDAMIAAVNHNGDSDSTGAIAGNIMGAKIGYEAIEDKWKDRLELSDTILKLADELTEAVGVR